MNGPSITWRHQRSEATKTGQKTRDNNVGLNWNNSCKDNHADISMEVAAKWRPGDKAPKAQQDMITSCAKWLIILGEIISNGSISSLLQTDIRIVYLSRVFLWERWGNNKIYTHHMVLPCNKQKLKL